jgi:glycosyltransferase involved in cell wall biosynthesis
MSMWSPGAAATRARTGPNDAWRPPGITIVVTSRDNPARLHNFLEEFAACCREAEVELIVVRAGPPSELPQLIQQFSTATFLAADSTTTDSDLRRIGFAHSSRDLILFLEDHAAERHEWAVALCRNWRSWVDNRSQPVGRATCGVEQSLPYPYLSVVMPVRNGGPTFLLALQAMALSDLPRRSWELVVVDDSSTDESPFIAAQYADKVLRLRHGHHGPSYARNRGFELTMGECVAFINADVMVNSDTLRKAATVLMEQPDVAAVLGCCDASPMTKGLLSKYRNEVLRYHQHRDAGDAVTFLSACGIVRSAVFEKAGGYDEWHFSRRQLEDLELGQRIRSVGERIVLHPDIRASHLRHWTLRRMITTEIFDRAVPWMRLVQRQLTRDRNRAPHARRTKNINIIVSWLGAICALLAWREHVAILLLPSIASLFVVLLNSVSQLAFFSRERGVLFAAASFPLDVLYYLVSGIGVLFGWIARQAVGAPTPGAVAEAFTEMGVKRWPPIPVKRIVRSAPSPAEEARTTDRDAAEPPPTTAELRLSSDDARPDNPPNEVPHSLQ